MNATPRPWFANGNKIESAIMRNHHANDAVNEFVAKCHTFDNARFIVRAVNSYDAIRNALTRLTEKVERANSLQHSGGTIDADDWSELYQLTNEARALLKEPKP